VDLRKFQEAAALAIFNNYLKGSWSSQNSLNLEACLSKEDQQELSWAIQTVFWNQTLELLSKSGGAKKVFIEQVKGSGFQMFKMVGYFDEQSPDGDKAGFDRANKQLFLDFSKIPATEWLVIFIHVVSHSLDPYLISGTEAFADEKTYSDILRMTSKTTSPERLTAKERGEMFDWLRAGLDQKFLAEYRAWTITIKLYLEGKNILWPQIDWLENILKNRKSGEALNIFTLRYLSPRFTSNDEGIFKNILIKNSLTRFREGLLSGQFQAPLGGPLETIYNSTPQK
jgi:hypothetical protein